MLQIGSLANATSSENYSQQLRDISQTYTLNTQQSLAFKIVCLHSIDLERKSKPLRMYLGGPGGTGKSRVIHAVTDWFAQRGQSRRLRLASYTGVAASNINGATLHAVLMLTRRSYGASAKKSTLADMQKLWEGVDYLLIDEVSMIGCAMLTDIHNAL
ncbi:hypothetical protein SISNIDRAFT_414933, partial [Sistotremastrum niveocremeum HHB9708]